MLGCLPLALDYSKIFSSWDKSYSKRARDTSANKEVGLRWDGLWRGISLLSSPRLQPRIISPLLVFRAVSSFFCPPSTPFLQPHFLWTLTSKQQKMRRMGSFLLTPGAIFLEPLLILLAAWTLPPITARLEGSFQDSLFQTKSPFGFCPHATLVHTISGHSYFIPTSTAFSSVLLLSHLSLFLSNLT